MRKQIYRFLHDDNRGIGIVEMILILLVLVGLVVLFKTQVTGIVTRIFTTITQKVNSL